MAAAALERGRLANEVANGTAHGGAVTDDEDSRQPGRRHWVGHYHGLVAQDIAAQQTTLSGKPGRPCFGKLATCPESTYFDRDPKGGTGGRVSDCVCFSISQMGQDQISFKIPCSLKDSGCSTRLCVVHLAVGKPLSPVPRSSSIIFELPPWLRGSFPVP